MFEIRATHFTTRAEPISPRGLYLLHQAGLEGFDPHPDALDLAAGELNPHLLQVGAEGATRALGHVRADAAGFFSHAAAVNDAALGRAFAGDETDAGHMRC